MEASAGAVEREDGERRQTLGEEAVVGIAPLWRLMPHAGFALIVAGGLAYTAGVAFFLLGQRWRCGHFVWHLVVLAGTTCHFFAVLWYAG